MQPSLRTFPAARRRASTLLAVMFFVGILAVLTGSILKFTGNERRGNERNRLILRARNMAENVALYASEQITTKLYKLRTVAKMKFTGSNSIALPPSTVTTTSYSTSADVEVYAGITSNTALALITDTSSANYGLQVQTGTIPVISKSTMRHPALGTVTAYAEQRLQINLIPLFQFAIFYDKDLEVSPGADMVIAGPVHTNGNLIARSQSGFSNTIQFLRRVTAVGGYFASTGYKGTIWNEYDSGDSGPGGDGPIKFQNTSGTVTEIKSSGGVYRDHRYGGTNVTTTSLNNFKTFTNTYYAGNFRTSVHGVTSLELPGVDTTDDNKGRTTIEPPMSTDSATLKTTKFSRNAGLYIVANPDDETRTGTLPDESTVYVQPRSYRAWLNSVSSSGTYTLKEVVLPGQPSYGYNAGADGVLGTADDFMHRNYLPNRYTTLTEVGSNQVLRLPQQEYTSGSGYLINTATSLATGTTSIPVDTGTGRIPPGEVVRIGNFRYLVTDGLNATSATFRIASPGLLETVTNDTAVVVEAPGQSSTAGGLQTDTGTTYPIGTTAINLDNSTTGIIQPGDTITFASHNYRYLVVSALRNAPGSTSTDVVVNIAQPGLRATLANNVALSVDAASETLGDGLNLYTSAAVSSGSFTSGGAVVSATAGSGGLVPGNQLAITSSAGVSNRYFVASVHTSGVSSGLAILAQDTTAGVTDIASGAALTLDPYPYSGYTLGTPVLSTSTTTIPDAFFYDLRRATNSTGHPFSRSSSTPFTPRPIAKIDFDMARFKLAVSRTLAATSGAVFVTATTSTGYNVGVPNATNWNTNILKSDASTATLNHGLGSAFTTVPGSASIAERLRQDPFRIYFAPSGMTVPSPFTSIEGALADNPSVYGTGSTDYTTPWYDGITVYVQSVGAENLTESSTGVRNRIDSGVRLWNGRGPAPSLADAGKTGFSFCTNDAVYIAGHFNADGTIDSSSTDTGSGSPNFYGGYSALYPDSSSEKLSSIMGDAITILSQPVFTSSSGNYYQTDGWSDTLSGTRVRTGNWSSSWATSNPGSSNAVDGEDNSLRPARMPNLGTAWQHPSATSRDTKLPPEPTEVSACLLTGIVTTDAKQHSGGVHNYPRLLEQWAGTGLYIRGSMVAMFASRVATEYWSIRIYSGAGRYWGLHNGLTNADHDVPLEPILLNAQRLRYTELTKAEYDATKTDILAQP